MRGQERQVILAAGGVYDDGCGKTAIDGQDRRGGEAIEMECLLLITQQDQFLVRTGIALRIVKSDAQRHHHRLFCVLSRCGRDGLLQPQGSTAALRVMFNHRLHAWRTGLLIPEPKLCEVDTATILHGAHEILARSEEHTSELQSLMRTSYA